VKSRFIMREIAPGLFHLLAHGQPWVGGAKEALGEFTEA
jgi:hypothetical protein